MTHWSRRHVETPLDSPPAVVRVPGELRGADGVLSSADEVAYLQRVSAVGPHAALAEILARRAAG